MKRLLQLLLLLSSTGLFAQKESYNWWMFKRIGLDFNTVNSLTGYPTQLPGLGSLRGQGEGVATLSNKDGQLLFYTNGDTVFSSNHAMMANGGRLFGDESTTQVLIVPDPRDNCRAYIFTADVQAGRIPMISRCGGCLSYSVADMSQNGGLGAVVTKNVVLHSPVTEKLTAVKHANGHDVWILAHEWNSNRFLAFLLTDAGVNTIPVISSIGLVHGPSSPASTSGGEATGALKASPDGAKLVCMAKSNGGIELFGFNNSTGVVSNGILFPNTPNDYRSAYIAEFSPDNTKLYVSNAITGTSFGEFLQFDLSSFNLADILASRTLITANVKTFGGLQLGPDGKIYTSLEFPRVISVINNPNAAGMACDYDPAAIPMVIDPSEMGTNGGVGTEIVTGLPQLTVGTMSCPMTVPVTLLKFGAAYSKEGAVLSWTTASENGCTRFSVEKSSDGVNFNPFGTVACTGSASVKNYSLTDKAPFPGIVYYRLKAEGSHGLKLFERTVALETHVRSYLAIKPNPVSHGMSIFVDFRPEGKGPVSVKVYNLFGEIVYRLDMASPEGNLIELDSRVLSPGQYILECGSTSSAERRKLVICGR